MGKEKYIVEENPYGFLVPMSLNKRIDSEVRKIILANKNAHNNHSSICFLSLHSRPKHYIVQIISVHGQRLRVFQLNLGETGMERQTNFFRSKFEIPNEELF